MTSLEDVLSWSELLVVAQKPSAKIAERIRASNLPVLDLVSGHGADGRYRITRSAAA